MIFAINGIEWILEFVNPQDYHLLMDNVFTLGVTDLDNHIIYIADNLYGRKLYDVIWHEITHCWLYSYGYDIDIPCEEIVCQVVERDSDEIQDLAFEIYSLIK